MKRQSIIIGLILCLLLCACGTKPATEQFETNPQKEALEEAAVEESYSLNNITVPDADAALGELLPEGGERYILLNALAGENMYRMTEIYPEAGNYEVVNYCVQILEPPYTEWIPYSLDMSDTVLEPGYYIREAYLEADGTIKFLLQNNEINYIGQWNAENGFSAKELTVDMQLGEIFDDHMYGDWYDNEADGVFFLYEGFIRCFDESGAEKLTTLARTGGLFLQVEKNPFSDKLYFMGANEASWSMTSKGLMIEDGGFSIWAADSGEAVFVAENVAGSKPDEINCALTGDEGSVTFSSETEGYLCNQIGIYRFSMEDQSRKQILNFSDTGMGPGAVSPIRMMDMSVGDGGTLLVLCEYIDGKSWFAKLEKQTAGDGKAAVEKQKLELAVVAADSYLKKAVVDFNKQSEKYEIVLRTCSEKESADDYCDRIQAELSAGKGPDIMNTSVLDTTAGARKGFLLDLTEYFNSYQEQLFPTVRQLGKVDEKYYGIPYSFNVMTLIAGRDAVGNRQSWTLEEAMQCMEQSSADSFLTQIDGSYLYYYLGLMTENPKLIDWENRVSHLDSDESCALLEFAARYSHDDAETGLSGLEQLAKGQSLAEVLYLLTPQTAQYVSDYLHGSEVYIGFPTEDKSGGHRLTGSVLQINRNSAVREGAIEFIEYLLSEDQQTYLADSMLEGHAVSGYPVRNSALEGLFTNLHKEAKLRAQEDDAVENVLTLTSEQYDRLWEVLESARLYGNETDVVLDIILEESEAYWTGVKSSQQVLEIVNNRVQLYLDEDR